jgi:hypothetical protein
MPPEADNELVLGLVADSKPVVGKSLILGSIATSRYLLAKGYPLLPDWQEWEDGLAGQLRLTNREGDSPALAEWEDGRLTTPYNHDGITIRKDTSHLVTVGFKNDENVRVFWGVLTKPLADMLADPGEVIVDHVFSSRERPDFEGFYNYLYQS